MRALALALLVMFGAAGAAGAQQGGGPGADFPLAPGGRVFEDHVPSEAGAARLALRSLRFEPAPGTAVFRNVYWCGVVLGTAGPAPQSLITIGQGRTEVLDCRRLLEVGPLAAPAGARRIGLIYVTASPNAAGRTLVILRQDAEAALWRSEDELAQRIEDRTQPLSLARVRARLARLPGG